MTNKNTNKKNNHPFVNLPAGVKPWTRFLEECRHFGVDISYAHLRKVLKDRPRKWNFLYWAAIGFAQHLRAEQEKKTGGRPVPSKNQ